MTPIQSLLDEADRLSRSFHMWNNIYMYLVFTTAVFVALTFMAQWKAKTEAEALDVANKAVISGKDEQLKEEFTHRDERIAKVQADANVQIAGVKADSDQKIAAADKRSDEISAEARRKAEELKAQNLVTANQLVAAQKALEEEKIARIKIEEYFAPRKIEGSRAAILLARLASLKGKKVTLFVLMSDPETGIFASRLAELMRLAGLEVTQTPGMLIGNIPTGLTLQVGDNRLPDANILAAALHDAELAPLPIPADSLPKERADDLTVIVGPKH